MDVVEHSFPTSKAFDCLFFCNYKCNCYVLILIYYWFAGTLPNGDTNYNINNCMAGGKRYNIFIRLCNGLSFLQFYGRLQSFKHGARLLTDGDLPLADELHLRPDNSCISPLIVYVCKVCLIIFTKHSSPEGSLRKHRFIP